MAPELKAEARGAPHAAAEAAPAGPPGSRRRRARRGRRTGRARARARARPRRGRRPGRAAEHDRMPALAAVRRREHVAAAFAPGGDERGRRRRARGRARRRGARPRRRRRAERGEPAAQRRARPALPVGALDDAARRSRARRRPRRRRSRRARRFAQRPSTSARRSPAWRAEPGRRAGGEDDGGHGARIGVRCQATHPPAAVRSHQVLREPGYRPAVLRIAAGLLSLAALALVGPAAGSSPARMFAPRAVGEGQVSSNWAGYASPGRTPTGAPTTYTNVTGTWVQPKVKCTAGRVVLRVLGRARRVLRRRRRRSSRSAPSRTAPRAAGPSTTPGTRSSRRRRSRSA